MLSSSPAKIHKPHVIGVSPRPTDQRGARKLRNTRGKFRFRLKASNGQVVATGEAYESKSAAKKGCESVLRAATGAPIDEVDS